MTRAAAALFVAAAWLAGAVLGWIATGLLGRVWANRVRPDARVVSHNAY